MSLRIAFDVDGVLADMSAALRQKERQLFGSAVPADTRAEGAEEATPEAQSTGTATDPLAAEMRKHGLTAGQQRQLWKGVASTENFWETLDECEPGGVRSLAQLADGRQWEIIFLTSRPGTAGVTCQVQTQRWLQRHGFPIPAVFVVQGSRGKIADALHLDVVVDDLPENCVDVLSDSKARAILMWRGASNGIPASAQRLGIAVVSTVAECLHMLGNLDDEPQSPTIVDRVKWALGLSSGKRLPG